MYFNLRLYLLLSMDAVSTRAKKMSEARIELAIFGFVDRRNIHY